MFPHRLLAIIVLWVLASFPPTLAAQDKSLAQQIADVMVQVNGGIHPGFRFAHAKGLVLTGTFTPAIAAMFPAQGPAALTTRSAPRVSLLPVRKFLTFTPITLWPEQMRSVTS